MAKNRYKIENNIINDLDGSFTAEEYYETDELLVTLDDRGIRRYKIVDNNHVLRSQEEMDADYFPTYKQIILVKLRELFVKKFPDSSKDISALTAHYRNIKTASANWTTIADADAAYENYLSFMDITEIEEL